MRPVASPLLLLTTAYVQDSFTYLLAYLGRVTLFCISAPTYYTHSCTLRTHRPAFPFTSLFFYMYTVYVQYLLHKDLWPLSSVYCIFNWIEPLLKHSKHACMDCFYCWKSRMHGCLRYVSPVIAVLRLMNSDCRSVRLTIQRHYLCSVWSILLYMGLLD